MNPAYELANKDFGTWEWGKGHNPKVLQYFADVGHSWVKDDETAWCAAFVGAMLKRAGLPHTGKLNARSYLEWGEPVQLSEAKEGDIVVLWRGSPNSAQGHVGFFVRQQGNRVDLLGGNQGNQVNITGFPVERVLAVRRDPSENKPTTVRVVENEDRAHPIQSKTILGASSQIAAAIGSAIAALRGLDGTAQIVVLGGLILLGGFSLWLIKDRLKRWGAGER